MAAAAHAARVVWARAMLSVARCVSSRQIGVLEGSVRHLTDELEVAAQKSSRQVQRTPIRTTGAMQHGGSVQLTACGMRRATLDTTHEKGTPPDGGTPCEYSEYPM